MTELPEEPICNNVFIARIKDELFGEAYESFVTPMGCLCRVTGNDKGVVAAEPAPRKASAPVVQMMTRPHPWFKRVALDGKWRYVYADHIRYLTKKRHRVEGVRVQGYTAGGLKVEALMPP